jgi:hypothetical protein
VSFYVKDHKAFTRILPWDLGKEHPLYFEKVPKLI